MYPNIHIIIPSYMVFAILGAFSAMIFLYLRIEKIQLAFVDFLKMFGFSIVFGAIGSRVLFFLTRVPWLVTHFSVAHLLSSILGGGFVFYGGLFGVLYGIRHYCRKHGIDQRKIYNLIAPAIPLFHAFGRIGCFLAGCCYGFSLSTPIIIFGGLKIHRFPTQIVEAIFVFLLFVVLYFVQRKERKLNYLRIYLLSYAVFRFLIEFTRGDMVRGVVAGISTSQIISVIVIVVCCIKAKKESAQKRAETSEEVCEAEITNA